MRNLRERWYDYLWYSVAITAAGLVAIAIVLIWSYAVGINRVEDWSNILKSTPDPLSLTIQAQQTQIDTLLTLSAKTAVPR